MPISNDANDAIAPPGWLTQARLIIAKDLRIESRTGEVTTTSAYFSLLVVVLSSLSFSGAAESQRLVASGTLWLTLAFAAILALSRSWQREREDLALVSLLSLRLSRSALFFGKFVGLSIFLLVVLSLVIPLVALFFSIDLLTLGLPLVAISLIAIPGISAAGTLFGAMTVRTSARDLVLAIVLFPLLAPSLLCAVVATRELLSFVPLAELGDYLLLMALFDFVFLLGGLTLFGILVES